ncbi:MAG TPA: GNAT family N-acetyltransferase [Acidimicrobiales bacterium]|nr:GNAT family N-acetyltransferase [Acidimicrobiales bacterium]
MRTARTWVWVDGEEVVAYFSLSGHAVKRSDVPRKVGRGSPEWIPTVLIARLALDKRLHGQGLGAELLIGSWRRIIEASELVALRIVVVDAIDDSAVMFYEHFGFDVIPGTRRLVRRVSDIASDLADD